MKYSLILLSAGKGIRFGKSTPKQYLMFSGKPMIVHSMENIDDIKEIEEVVVVCSPESVDLIKGYISSYHLTKKYIFVNGGETRQESVYNGLKQASCSNVVIHEAARPLVTKRDFETLINSKEQNVSYTYTIPYTVLKKNEENCISDILNRKELVNIQLPQKFEKTKLLKAHEFARSESKIFTEDASLFYYYLKERVYCLNGKVYNIKMTEFVDLFYGEALLKDGII